MKFFTRGWADGEATDEDSDEVVPAYWRHVEEAKLPRSVRDLADLNPHDGYILNVEHDPQSRALRLRLRYGHLQIGYFDAVVEFSDVIIQKAHLELLHASRRPNGQILYDEVDRVDASIFFEYRLLLDPNGEVAIRFRDVAIARHPVSER